MPKPSRINELLLSTCIDQLRKVDVFIDGQKLLELENAYKNFRFNLNSFTLEQLFAFAFISPVIANSLFKNRNFTKTVKSFKKGDKKVLAKNQNFNLDLAFDALERRYNYDLNLMSLIEKVNKDKNYTQNTTDQLFVDYVIDAKVHPELAKSNLHYLLTNRPDSFLAIDYQFHTAVRVKSLVEMDRDLNGLYVKAIEDANERDLLKPEKISPYVKVANIHYLADMLNPSIFNRIGAIFVKVVTFGLLNSKTTHEYITPKMLADRIAIEFAPEAPTLKENIDKLKLISGFLKRRILGKNYWETATPEDWSVIINTLKTHEHEGIVDVTGLMRLTKKRYAQRYGFKKLSEAEADWVNLPSPQQLSVIVRPPVVVHAPLLGLPNLEGDSAEALEQDNSEASPTPVEDERDSLARPYSRLPVASAWQPHSSPVPEVLPLTPPLTSSGARGRNDSRLLPHTPSLLNGYAAVPKGLARVLDFDGVASSHPVAGTIPAATPPQHRDDSASGISPIFGTLFASSPAPATD